MRIFSLAVLCAGLCAGAATPRTAAADCGHHHKPYPPGGVMCQGGFQFVCEARGVWHKTLDRCEAASPAGASSPRPPSDEKKVPPSNTQSNASGNTPGAV